MTYRSFSGPTLQQEFDGIAAELFVVGGMVFLAWQHVFLGLLHSACPSFRGNFKKRNLQRQVRTHYSKTRVELLVGMISRYYERIRLANRAHIQEASGQSYLLQNPKGSPPWQPEKESEKQPAIIAGGGQTTPRLPGE